MFQLDDYEPPEDMNQVFPSVQDFENSEKLLIFKVPSQVSLKDFSNSLSNFQLNAKTNLISVEKKQQKIEKYSLEAIKSDSNEMGELKSLKLVIPSKSKNNFTTREIQSFYLLKPQSDHAAISKSIKKGGQEALDVEYVPRVHPDGMKLQCFPIGHDTRGKALDESLLRYKLSTAPEVSSKKRPASAPASSKKKSKKEKKE